MPRSSKSKDIVTTNEDEEDFKGGELEIERKGMGIDFEGGELVV